MYLDGRHWPHLVGFERHERCSDPLSVGQESDELDCQGLLVAPGEEEAGLSHVIRPILLAFDTNGPTEDRELVQGRKILPVGRCHVVPGLVHIENDFGF